MAGLQEIGRHAGAHATQSDKANFHGFSPSFDEAVRGRLPQLLGNDFYPIIQFPPISTETVIIPRVLQSDSLHPTQGRRIHVAHSSGQLLSGIVVFAVFF
jgi:hypothetical protein